MLNLATMTIRTLVTQSIKWLFTPMIQMKITSMLDQRRKTKSKKITKSYRSIHKSITKALARNPLTLKSKRSKKTLNWLPVTTTQTSIIKHKIVTQKDKRSKWLIKGKISDRISLRIMEVLAIMSKVLIKASDNGVRKIKRLMPGFC